MTDPAIISWGIKPQGVMDLNKIIRELYAERYRVQSLIDKFEILQGKPAGKPETRRRSYTRRTKPAKPEVEVQAADEGSQGGQPPDPSPVPQAPEV
jgi:hypothetical protein